MSEAEDRKRGELVRQLESLRPGALPPKVASGTVTGVFELTFEQLERIAEAARTVPPRRIQKAATQLIDESERTCELTRRLSQPPSK